MLLGGHRPFSGTLGVHVNGASRAALGDPKHVRMCAKVSSHLEGSYAPYSGRPFRLASQAVAAGAGRLCHIFWCRQHSWFPDIPSRVQ